MTASDLYASYRAAMYRHGLPVLDWHELLQVERDAWGEVTAERKRTRSAKRGWWSRLMGGGARE